MQFSRYIQSPGQPQCLVNCCSLMENLTMFYLNFFPDYYCGFPSELAMLLFKQNFSSQLREAFSQSLLEREGSSPKIIAEDAELEVNYTSVAILSPFFRGLVTSLPTCCSPLHLSLPGTTASSVQLFFSLLADGTTKEVKI